MTMECKTDRRAAAVRPYFDGKLSGKRVLWRIIASVSLLAVLLFSRFEWSPLPSCRFKALTGYSCPTCGMTRSFHALVHGEILDAFRFNPMGPAFFFILFLVLTKLSLEVTTGRKVSADVPKPLVRVVLSLLLGLWLGFGITRLLLEMSGKG